MVERDYVTFSAITSSIVGIGVMVYGIPEVKAFGGVLVGAAVTYFVQTQLQKQSEKNKIRRQNLENTFIPLYLLLKNLLNELKTTERKNTSNLWSDINSDYRRFIFNDDLHEEINEFFNASNDYDYNLRNVEQGFYDLINKSFISFFLNKISISEDVVQYPRSLCFTLLWKDLGYYKINFLAPVILGLNPFEIYRMKNHRFNENNVEININIYVRDDENRVIRTEECIIELRYYKDEFNKYLIMLKEIIDNEKEVMALRDQYKELMKRAEKTLSKLKNHIEKFYPVESIKE